MKLVVFGATGGTGRLLVQRALDDGQQVTAVVRDPARLPVEHPELDVVVADVFDSSSLEPVLKGHDAALSALGPRDRKDTTGVCAAAVGAILGAMDVTGVRRIVALSAQPVLGNGAGEPLWQRITILPIVRAVFRNVYADLDRMETILRRTDTDWTILRPPYLTDGAAHGNYRNAIDANVPGSMTRADLALAMLDVLDQPATIRRGVGVASPK